MVTRVSSGTRVPGSGSTSTAPHPVGYPVPNVEAGVQLYSVDELFTLHEELPPRLIGT